MGRCFVIQPFDGGAFDKRYEDVFMPAIRAAGLEPYRVDRGPHVTVPIDDIEAGIRCADVCLADISLDNPNIWFELGYALASNKEVVIVCAADRRSTFPFDVQHRSIIRYATDSVRDFETLKSNISTRLKAILEKAASMSRAAELPPLRPVEGLQQHEIACLIAIAENLDSPGAAVDSYHVRNDMERFGYTRVAVNLAIAALVELGMITEREELGSYQKCYLLAVTRTGLQWLQSNKYHIMLHTEDHGPPDLAYEPENSDPFADE